jgi:hypothetical protein
LLCGCGRRGFDEVGDAGDIGATSPTPVTHVPSDAWVPGDGELIVSGSSVLDTAAVLLDGSAMPAGGRLFVSPQVGGGSDVVVLAVGSLVIESSGVLRVVGTRPLVIVAGSDIDIRGVLDGGARTSTPGAGGAAPAMGRGVGGAGNTGGLYDSGGGGAGFGKLGAAGGPHTCSPVPGGAFGATYDDGFSTLSGGSGGGAGSPGACVASQGGAGGGAIQLSASSAIAIAGSINVGGGGGGGGPFCNGNDGGGGSGGGSGGALFLEAPQVDIGVGAVIAANGGAGGSGGSGAGPAGSAGKDGAASATPALGPPGVNGGAAGGDGGWRDAAAIRGADGTCNGAAGGGGGGVGRIAIRSSGGASSGIVTPDAISIAY